MKIERAHNLPSTSLNKYQFVSGQVYKLIGQPDSEAFIATDEDKIVYLFSGIEYVTADYVTDKEEFVCLNAKVVIE